MAKMKIAPKDRPKVKLECLRLLAALHLDPAKSKLIGGFIETYLKLTAEEMKQYEREFAKLTPAEQEATMELMTSWERAGIEKGREEGKQEGRQEGKEELVARLIQRRLGAVSPQLLEQLAHLSSEQLNELGVALLDFTTAADLETWLSRYTAQ
jgi:flagellar biosynthesis/type III secretory pathway protein FliH